MPKVSEFFGIVILMYYREHPPADFHAVYQGEEAVISIEDRMDRAVGLGS